MPAAVTFLGFLLGSAEDYNCLRSGDCRYTASGKGIKDKKKMASWIVKEGLAVGKEDIGLTLVGQAQL